MDTIAHWDILLKIDFLSHSSILDRVEIFRLFFAFSRERRIEFNSEASAANILLSYLSKI